MLCMILDGCAWRRVLVHMHVLSATHGHSATARNGIATAEHAVGFVGGAFMDASIQLPATTHVKLAYRCVIAKHAGLN